MGLKAGGLRGSLRSVSTGVPAIPDSAVVDSFEDGDISEYGGNTGSFTVQQSTVFPDAGSYALQRDGSASNDSIGSSSGLPNYPASGDEFGWLIHIPSSTSPSDGGYLCQTKFAEQATDGESDGNGTQHRTGENSWNVGRIGSGISNDTVSTTVDYAGLGLYDQWLEERITAYDGSQFTATLYDGPSWDGGSEVASQTYSGTVRSSGGVSFASYDQVVWDHYALYNG